jgi:cation diffusion facilitator family transporter
MVHASRIAIGEDAGGSDQPGLKRYAVLSVVAALVTISLKGTAYWITGSVGLLSDALESMVNLVAATIALFALVVAARPADEEHAYGHTKVEYFASGFEGALILFAAATIGFAAIGRLVHPQPVVMVGVGLVLVLIATAVNFAVARLLLQAGKRHDSIVLEANARHLMTDVWTSGAVMLGVALTGVTGWLRLDPILGLLVAANIVGIGWSLLRRSALGLLDTAVDEETRERIVSTLRGFETGGVHFHALRTRQAGTRRFVSFHILVPGEWTVQRGHDLLEQIEEAVRDVVPNSTVFTHLEPIEDPLSWDDLRLERRAGRPSPPG